MAGDIAGFNERHQQFTLGDLASVPVPQDGEVAARAIWEDDHGKHESPWQLYPRT